ncbi:MAG: DUF1236 domain-containing protein [Bradyrhizobiaceae bacterium]|nr:DUF1236 domain-containing protein [Bradyrhizobiaceae bacterium]
MKSKFMIATTIAALLTATSLAVAEAAEAKHNAPAARPAPPHAAVHAPAPSAAPRPVVRAPAPPSAARPVVRAPAPPTRAQSRATVTPSKSQARLGEPSAERERRGYIGQRAERRPSNTVLKSDRERQIVQPQQRERAATAGPPRGAAVALSSEQRSRIREVILRQHNRPRIARADFDIRIGERIPRDRLRFVDLEPLPQTIVEVEPAWQGYLYFLVGDEIVVVDPYSLEIVAILPA